ncbi:MAG: hypothetical protein ACT4OE_06005 [Sphingosinicella sp.]
MTPLAPDQWLVMILAFVLGLLIGLAMLASPKWKRRYRSEAAARADEQKAHMQERKRWALEAQQLKEQSRRRADQEAAERAQTEAQRSSAAA